MMDISHLIHHNNEILNINYKYLYFMRNIIIHQFFFKKHIRHN